MSTAEEKFEEAKFRQQREGGELEDYLNSGQFVPGGYCANQSADENSELVAEWIYLDPERKPYLRVQRFKTEV